MEDELELLESAAEEQMQSAVAHLDDTLQHIRAGKANPRILDPIKIEYYGTMSPLSSCATVTTPDARTIAITPWEKKLISEIERAILPPLTEERRRELCKQCKAEAENAKMSIRNARRDAIEEFKKLVKNGLSEDIEKDAEEEMQKTHDKYIAKVDALYAAKEKEIMTV